MVHLSDDDLERYYLGMISAESELAAVEEHLLACPGCVARAEETQDYVDAVRGAIIEGGYDPQVPQALDRAPYGVATTRLAFRDSAS
jgi:anti-sigma factor RsiW